MIPNNATPLGYIELENGAKPIYPMNDIFLNYTFDNPANWENLRTTVNLIIEANKNNNPTTTLKPIEGNIKVSTQFKHLLTTQNKTRDQDIKITASQDDATYIEFQNRAKPQIPIEIRAVEYFGLGIGHSKGKLANQIWLLAEDVDVVLHGKTFARYILKDEVTGKEHPATSGILYVSLTKLSKENTPAGETASFLLGKLSDPTDKTVKRVSEAFKNSFEAFKAEKELSNLKSSGNE